MGQQHLFGRAGSSVLPRAGWGKHPRSSAPPPSKAREWDHPPRAGPSATIRARGARNSTEKSIPVRSERRQRDRNSSLSSEPLRSFKSSRSKQLGSAGGRAGPSVGWGEIPGCGTGTSAGTGKETAKDFRVPWWNLGINCPGEVGNAPSLPRECGKRTLPALERWEMHPCGPGSSRNTSSEPVAQILVSLFLSGLIIDGEERLY